LESLPIPTLTEAARRFLAHGALRLSCGHAGFAELWREQVHGLVGWPAMVDPDARWTLRAAMDAVVADAYGLAPIQYASILANFSHRSRPDAARLCLSALDALQAEGVEAFCRNRDEYHAVPLVLARAAPPDQRCRRGDARHGGSPSARKSANGPAT